MTLYRTETNKTMKPKRDCQPKAGKFEQVAKNNKIRRFQQDDLPEKPYSTRDSSLADDPKCGYKRLGI